MRNPNYYHYPPRGCKHEHLKKLITPLKKIKVKVIHFKKNKSNTLSSLASDDAWDVD